jgi:hypothetical protein
MRASVLSYHVAKRGETSIKPVGQISIYFYLPHSSQIADLRPIPHDWSVPM